VTAYDESREVALSPRRRALAIAGAVMALVQVAAAASVAGPTTGDGAGISVILALWLASVAWSVPAVLLLARRADLPDLFTASMLVDISVCGVYATVAGLDARGTDSERNLVDTMFFGVTTGALTALVVWAITLVIARLLHLPGAAPGTARDR
jgi:hypothetical protein